MFADAVVQSLVVCGKIETPKNDCAEQPALYTQLAEWVSRPPCDLVSLCGNVAQQSDMVKNFVLAAIENVTVLKSMFANVRVSFQQTVCAQPIIEALPCLSLPLSELTRCRTLLECVNKHLDSMRNGSAMTVEWPNVLMVRFFVGLA